MRRSTTSAGTESATTERCLLGLGLLAQLVIAVVLIQPAAASPVVPAQAPPPVSVPAARVPAAAPTVGSRSLGLRDGRTAELIDLGGSPELLARVGAELDGAADAVTAFWGDRWPRTITVVAVGSDEQFRVLAAGDPDIAATTTAERITFSPGAAAMSPAALRIVVRHELFHYAARAETAADAPRWLTEGVADFVGRPPERPRVDPGQLTTLPTDADLDTPGAVRSLAYDRAWWFSRYVADRYGVAALSSLYRAACGPGHPDVDTAVATTLHTDTAALLAGWRQWASG